MQNNCYLLDFFGVFMASTTYSIETLQSVQLVVHICYGANAWEKPDSSSRRSRRPDFIFSKVFSVCEVRFLRKNKGFSSSEARFLGKNKGFSASRCVWCGKIKVI